MQHWLSQAIVVMNTNKLLIMDKFSQHQDSVSYLTEQSIFAWNLFMHKLLPLIRRLCFWSLCLFVGLSLLFVCLSVCDNITEKKNMNKLRWNFMELFMLVKGTKDWILVVIHITMLTAQLEIWPLLNKLQASFDKLVRIPLQLYRDQLFKFGRGGVSGSQC